MFLKYDGAIISPEDYDYQVEFICSLISNPENNLYEILDYIKDIDNIHELKDNNGKNLLMCACDSNNLHLIIYFLEHGIDINSVDNDNENILNYLDYSQDNATQIIDYLIKQGVNVFNKNINGTDIFSFLFYIMNNTSVHQIIEKVGKNIQYLLNWYSTTYIKNNFIDDPNFVKNVNSILLFGQDFVNPIFKFIEHVLLNLEILQNEINSLLTQLLKYTPNVKTNLEKIKILRHIIPSVQTEKIINNLIMKEDDKYIEKVEKIKEAFELCKLLIQKITHKREEINILLKTKESYIASAILLREEEREKEIKNKKERAKQKEKEKKKRKKEKKIEQEYIPKELKLMEKEDYRSYYNNMSYILIENKIDELLNELKLLSLKDKISVRDKNNLEKIILRRERDRKERENRIQQIIIHLDEEDYETEEDLKPTEDDKRILSELERIYEEQRINLNKNLQSNFK